MKIREITGDCIEFEDGTKITYFHDPDCCEDVYPDFLQLTTTAIMNEDFKDIKLNPILGQGIKLKSYLIPCYNIQNGYYSSDLELIITQPNGERQTIDISNCVPEADTREELIITADGIEI